MLDASSTFRDRVIRYGVAAGLSIVALVIRGLLPIEPGRAVYPVSLLAILGSAWLGGRGPGLLAAALSFLGLAYFFIPPLYRLAIEPGFGLGFVLFIGTALIIIEFAASRRAAQRRLQESEERFALIAANLPEVLWILSLHPEKVLYVSPSFEQVWGRRRDELMGDPKVWIRAIHEEDREHVATHFERWISERADDFDMEYRLRRADGSVRWIHDHGVLIRDRRGRAQSACGIAEDVTERRQMEEHLRASEERWRAAFENNPTMYFLLDASRTVRSVNPFGAEQLGYSVEELVRRDVLDLVHPEDREAMKRSCDRCLERLGESLRWELRKVRKDGQVIWVRESARAVRGQDGAPVLLVAGEDMTEARQTAEDLAKVQAELAHVTRVTTMGELAASIAHEINQPLTAIVSNASASIRWLMRNPPDLDEVKDATRRIADEGKRAGAIIERARALSRRSPAPRELLRLGDLVQEVAALLATEAQRFRVSIRSELATDVPPVLGDRVQLVQVLLNLGLNAIEAMSKVEGSPRILVIGAASDDQGRVSVSVSDSGPGLEEEAMQRLFEPFFSTKPNGMGMGLAISRSIIESHGGRISAARNSPRGMVFRFSFPPAPAAVGAQVGD